MGIWKGNWNKKLLFLLLTILTASVLTACSNTGQRSAALDEAETERDFGKKEDRMQIVCTAYPQYDWVQNLLGENSKQVEVTYLLKNGMDIHNYQPSVEDMITISDCDLLIYVGGQSEQWVEDARKNSRNSDQKVISMMEILKDRVWEEEYVEGMQKESNDHTEQDNPKMDGIEYDEHVWLSLKNAEQICTEIADRLGEIDSDCREVYQENLAAYLKQMDELDKKYQEMIEAAEQKTILIADRFPFRYLTEDYGLTYYAAFAGCSAETEASFETIAFLAQKVDELQLPVVYRIETSDDSVAKTVVNSTAKRDQKILVLDSLQAVTKEEVEAGITYLAVMEQNLELLREGLLGK